MSLLLISNSGQPPFGHCRESLARVLPAGADVAVVTAARLDDPEKRFQSVQPALTACGTRPFHYRYDRDSVTVLERADAIVVPGGITYALLQRLRHCGALGVIARLVRAGVSYVGASAGSNIAGRTILATNDWNVVATTRFEGMDLVPWAINPHYLFVDPASAPGSETRDQRIGELVSQRRQAVLAIEEQTAVLVEDGSATVVGTGRAKFFAPDVDPVWLGSGDTLPAGITP